MKGVALTFNARVPKEPLTMRKSKPDEELTELLTKLYTMQEDVGAKPKTSNEEKKVKAENIATMGKDKKSQAKGSRFLELKSTIVQRLRDTHSKLQQTKELENAGYGGDNPTQLIKLQAEIREEIRQAQDEWKEMDEIYKKEARKKRSKFTPEELETQQELVSRLYVEIEKIRSAQMANFAQGRPQNDAAAAILGSKLGGGT
jgi:syntaxin of plants SYP7